MLLLFPKWNTVMFTGPRREQTSLPISCVRQGRGGRKGGGERRGGRGLVLVGWDAPLCSALSRFIKCCRSFSGKSVPITLWTTWMLYLSPQHIFLYVLVLSFVLFFISCSGPLLHVHVLIVCVSYIFTQCQRCHTSIHVRCSSHSRWPTLLSLTHITGAFRTARWKLI